MHDDRAFGDVAAEVVPGPLRGRLPVFADHGVGILEDVYADGYAEPLRGEAALPRLPVSVREVRVHDVGLVDPDALPEDGPVLVSVHGGERPAAPLPGGLVGDAQLLGDAAQGRVVAHEPYERHPFRQLVAGVLEDRPCKGAVPAPARGASPSLDARCRPRVLHGMGLPALGALRMRPEAFRHLGERARTDRIPASALFHGMDKEPEFVVGKGGDPLREGVPRFFMFGCPICHATCRPGLVAKQSRRQILWQTLYLAARSISNRGQMVALVHPLSRLLEHLLCA